MIRFDSVEKVNVRVWLGAHALRTGGGIGGQITRAVLGALGVDVGGTLGMAGDVVSGGIGGIIVMAIVGLVKNMMTTQHQESHT
jgi:hypothetical protein